MNRVETIERALQDAFRPCDVHVRDDGHLHVGHEGAGDGRGHYTVTVVSDAFAQRRTLDRHRMVYAALGGLMETDIHALQIRALTPEENR